VTDANGDYSFALLAAGTYKVKFVNTAAATVQNSRLIASTAGPGTSSNYTNATGSGAARTAISPATSISTAAAGVVNAYFSVGPTAPSRNATALGNTAVVFNPFVTVGASSAATPSSSSTFSDTAKAATRLCDPTTTPPQNGTTVACTLTSRVVTGQGTWTVNTTSSSVDVGKITFTPSSGYSGTATPMTYSVTDAAGQKAAGSLTPTIIGAPAVLPDLSSGAFNTAQTITPLANDAAAAGESLTVSSVRLCAVSPVKNPPNCDDTTVTVSGQGTYTVNASGVVTFTPLSTFYGTATAMRYQVSDSVGQVANSTITPTVTAPPAVTANADTTSGGQGASQSANLLTNDVAPAGVTLVASSVRLCGPPSPFTCDDTVVTTSDGTYTVNASGAVTFTPLPGYTGTPTPPLGYQVTDSVGRNVTSTYTPRVVAVPSAVDDTSTGPYGQGQTISVMANDSAGAGTSLVASSVRLCGPGDDSTAQGAGGCDDTTLTTAAGTYTVNANGSVSFTPAPGFSGTAPPVAYQVADGLGQKDAGTITVTVAPLVGPNAGDDTLAVRPGGNATFDSITAVGGLAAPGDGSLVASNTCLVDPASGSVPKACDADDSVSVPGVGSWSLNRTTGVVTFTADSNAAPGASGSVDYRVIDANVQSAEGTLTALIPPAPVAVDDTSYGEQGQVQVLLPTGNDVPGIASAPMNPASVRLCGVGQPPGCDKTSLTVAEGTYAVNPATGAVDFTPVNDAFYGTVTPVAYQVADSTGQVGTAQLRPVVLPRPAPRAVDDTGFAAYGSNVVLTPLGNDDSGTIPLDDTTISGLTLDASSLKLCAAGQAPPTCTATSVTTVDGTYTLSASTVTFAPATGFSGTVTAPVQYQVSNSYTQASQSKSQTGTAYLIPSIGAPAPPSASNDSAVGLVNSAVTLSPLANDSAGQRFALVPGSLRLCGTGETAPNCTATTVNVAGMGTFTLNPATGAVTFTPLPDWTGAASVPYVVADAGGAVVSANLQVTVNAPVAADDTSYGRPGVVQAISVLGNDSPAAGTGTSLVGSTVRLCGPGQSGAA
jgi:CshA-type fibril repeat protein